MKNRPEAKGLAGQTARIPVAHSYTSMCRSLCMSYEMSVWLKENQGASTAHSSPEKMGTSSCAEDVAESTCGLRCHLSLRILPAQHSNSSPAHPCSYCIVLDTEQLLSQHP